MNPKKTGYRGAQTALRTTAAAAIVILASTCTIAFAQQGGQPGEDQASSGEAIENIVVTGSRIRRFTADSAAPISVIGVQDFDDRGYVSAAEALNQIPSLNPQLNQTDGSGSGAGSGQQFPDIFGIGAGRTLSLVNGRRFVASSPGLGQPQVDSNIIPTGLIERIDIVQAGGAAVYGSDAIAGVVNYVLRDDFEGMEFDVRYGDTSANDYDQQSVRATFGTNLADDRGNIAVNAEWASTPVLRYTDRPEFMALIGRFSRPNPADTGPNDGIPESIELPDQSFWNFNPNGTVWNGFPPPFPFNQPPPVPPFVTRLNGAPLQFTPGGSVVPYDPGMITGIPFSSGGDGLPYGSLEGLRTGTDRVSTYLVGHYDVTDQVRIFTELLYSRTVGKEPAQGSARTVLSPVGSGGEAIPFTMANPFLSADAIATLSMASRSFAGGRPLFLSKSFYTDLFPTDLDQYETVTWRGLAGVEGDFDWADRNFYWTTSVSSARVEGTITGYGIHRDFFRNAIAAVDDGSGNAVCAINADADPSNDDSACVAFNPFGLGNASQAARDYVGVQTGQDYVNQQVDFLATIGTSLFEMPSGDVEVVLAYEHRDEEADFRPFHANQLGLTGTGTKQIPESGRYNTDEYAIELLIPLVGDDFTFPGAQEIELSGTYRSVDNSIAGTEDVWSGNLRWVVTEDLTLRATKSRNFRAPTLTQLFTPTNVALTQAGPDPCDFRNIDEGPSPAVRRANCEAEWAMNPNYAPLATYQNSSDNFTTALLTSGGNRELRNEVSDTVTVGFVLQPRFVPNLTLSIDWVSIDLTDGLSDFTNGDFAAVCYDSSPQPAEFCNVFTRLQTGDGNSLAGSIITGRSTTVNAGSINFRGELYTLGYNLPLESVFDGGNPGDLSFSVQMTQTEKLETSVTGFDRSRTDNTVADPDWVGRFDAAYARDNLRVTYQLYYLGSVKASEFASIENSLNPVISSNTTHSISGQYTFGENVTVRAGVNNLTDEKPSFPTFTHGDVLGRRYFVGATAHF